jgi:uncharacterized repeat protein (TIGR03803 family)
VIRSFSIIVAAAALLAGCGGWQASVSPPGAMPQTAALTGRAESSGYNVLYSFSGGASDGADPRAELTNVSGTLYGTTEVGGPVNTTLHCYNGCGTVFSVTLGGTERVLHLFASGKHGQYDGQYPQAGLIDVGGTLYGTTGGGGVLNRGSVFALKTSGSEKVLHSFGGGADGSYSYSRLIDVNGTFYGTTIIGGTYYVGTVFRITTAGAENILYSFGTERDGQSPLAGVTDAGGTLYGTTYRGGTHSRGTVFAVTRAGAEKVLHSFGRDDDGRFPFANLIELKGKFYGTTATGGAFKCGKPGQGSHRCGVVFSITPGGTVTVLHSFGEGADGSGPDSGLIDVHGKLYGTTASGGAYGQGTIFSVTPGGTEKVLHSFGNQNDGRQPSAALVDVNGTLYGTTPLGGAHDQGTFFSLKPF